MLIRCAAVLSSRQYGDLLSDPLLVHATSRTDKLWPEANWQAVISAFVQSGLVVVLPWGDEHERARSERLAGGEAAAIVPPRQPLPALAMLMARAERSVLDA